MAAAAATVAAAVGAAPVQAAAAPLVNNARVGMGAVGGNIAPAGDPEGRRLERRLHFNATIYMLLGASFLLSAVVPQAGAAASPAVVASLLWAAAVAMAVLSLQRRRFPLAVRAADRLALAALRAFF